MGRTGPFPLDGAFATLRAEVEKTTTALAALRSGASSSAGSSGSSGGSGKGGALGGLLPSSSDIVTLGQAVKALEQVRRSTEAFGSLGVALGFKDARAQAELLGTRLQFAANIAVGLVGTLKEVKNVFLPIVAGAATLVVTTLALNAAVDSVTGTSSTLGEKLKVVYYEGKKGFAELGAVINNVVADVSGGFGETSRTQGFVDRMRFFDQAIGDANTHLNQLTDTIAGRGAPDTSTTGILATASGQLRELATQAQTLGENVLRTIDNSIGSSIRRTHELDAVYSPSRVQQLLSQLHDMGQATQATFDFIKQGIGELSGTIASSLLDAFLDPQKDIRQSFADLFRSLAQQLLQLAIQTAIVKAVSGIGEGISTGLSGGFGGAGGGFFGTLFGALTGNAGGQAEGGLVAARGHRPGLAHLTAPGYYAGGLLRPRGLHPTDTVPIWAAPGEFVMRKAAVDRWGPALAALNRSAGAPGTTPSVGFAAGGMVTAGSGAAGGVTVLPVLPTTPSTTARLMSNPAELARVIRDNRAMFKGALG